MATYTLKRGNTWNPILEIYTDTTKDTRFDATGYAGKCYIKEELNEDLPIVVEMDVSWTDQANGIGTISLSHTNSLKLRIHAYSYEVVVYTTGNAIRRTADHGTLDVVETLKKE